MPLSPENEREVVRLERVALWLDAKYTTPFGLRVGWDGILGLIPGVGEFVTTLISGYLVLRAAMLGVSTSILLRMGLNIVIDDVIGVIPLVGWIGDFAWKANLKNTHLIRAHFSDPVGARRRSTWVLVLVGAVISFVVILFAVLVGMLAWAAVGFLYSFVFTMGSRT